MTFTAENSLAVKREEKRLRAKLQLRQGEDDLGDDDEEEGTEEDEEGAGWGTKKRIYYDADGVSSLPLKEYCMPSLGTQGAQSIYESQCRSNKHRSLQPCMARKDFNNISQAHRISGPHGVFQYGPVKLSVTGLRGALSHLLLLSLILSFFASSEDDP